MSDPRTEAVAKAIAKVIVTKAVDGQHRRMDAVARVIAINQGVEAVWRDLLDEAAAAVLAATGTAESIPAPAMPDPMRDPQGFMVYAQEFLRNFSDETRG